MERKCLKCGHVNTAADGGYLEACPQCGAIYNKVERAAQTRADAIPRRAASAPAAVETKPSGRCLAWFWWGLCRGT